jgi:electron transfer flavoprotein alpha subunit
VEAAGHGPEQGIWVFAEHDGRGLKDITRELLCEARRHAERLNETLGVCLLGSGVAELVPALAPYGALKVYLVEHPALAQYDLAAWTANTVALIEAWRPAMLMFGDTAVGGELAARVAARLKLPCVTGVSRISAGRGGRLQLTKSVYDELAYATVEAVARRPLILTIPAGQTDVLPATVAVEPEVVRCEAVIEAAAPRTVLRRHIPGDPRTVAIEEAERIVAAGKGAGIEGMAVLEELAGLIGAAIGGSRVAADAGLVPRERQIGVSGSTVRPKLLIACGISGARQFTMGMENSELVIAVNSDGSAPIFEFANLRIKGDLHEIIPAVVRRLRGRTTAAAAGPT